MKCKYCEKGITNKGTLKTHEKSCKIISNLDISVLKSLYYDDLLTLREISNMTTGLGEQKIRDLIITEQEHKKHKKHNFKTKKCIHCDKEISINNYSRHIKNHERILKETDNIINEYLIGKLSIRELSIKYKTHHKNISFILLENNIKLRTHSESIKLSHELYPEKFKHSEETKKKLSEIHKNNSYGNMNYFRGRKTILYYIKLNDYHKIGITTRTVKERYRGLLLDSDTSFEILNEWVFKDGIQAAYIEQEILSNIKDEDRTDIKLLKNGNSEIFSKKYDKLIYETIKKYKDFDFNSIEIESVKKFRRKTKKNILKITKKKERKAKQKVDKYDLCSCGNKKLKKSEQCIDCSRKSQRKVKERPSYEQLITDIEETNYLAVGRKYGVSDNSIRKWIKASEKN